MAAEIEGGASMKSSEETKENNEDAIEESASDGVQHYTEHDSNAAPISVSTNSIVGGLPPSARPFRALLVDFTLAADDAQCVIALHWLEQHLLGLDRTQRVRECKQPFLKAITAKRNKSAAANARLARKTERDRIRRIASDEKAKGGGGAAAVAGEVGAEGSEGPLPFRLDAEEDSDLPKRRKSFAQRLGKLATKAASAVTGTPRNSNNSPHRGGSGNSTSGGGNNSTPDRTGAGSISPTSPGVSFRASLSRRSSSMMTAGTVAVLWGDNVHHTVTAVLKCYFDLSPIDTVPPVLMEHVFSYLHITKHHDLCAVCSEWDQYASGDVLWREIYFQRFKTFDHEEPLAPAALAPAAAATAEGGEGAAGEDAAPAAAVAAAVGNGASAGGGGAGTVGGIPAASAAARGGSTTAAPTTPVRSSASSGAGSGGSNSADSDSGGGVTKSGNGPTTSSASSSSTLPFGEPPPRTPPPTSTASAANVATSAATATPTTPTASTPNELPSSEQQRTPPPSSSRYPSFVVTPPPLYIGSSSGGGGGSTGSGVSRTRGVYSGGASESSPALDSSPAALSAILRRQSSGGDTVNTHGFKALFYRRLLDPWIGDHVEVAWRGKFRLEAMDVYQGLAWWEAVVVDKEVAPVAAAAAADPPSSSSPVPGGGIHRSPTLRGSSGYGTRLNDNATNNNNGSGGGGGGGAGATANTAASAAGLSARYKIHYPGWISRWDEWVDRSRLRWSWHTNNEAAIKTGDEVEVWCTGNNVPGAWLEAKVKKVRGLKFDVGKVLAGGTLWVEREKVRLVWKRSAEVHSRSLIGFTTRSLFPKPRRFTSAAATTTTTSSSAHSPSIHVAPLNVHHSTRASPPGGGQYVNGPHIGSQHSHRTRNGGSGGGGSGGSGNGRNRSSSGGSARSLVFRGLRRSPPSSSSSSSSSLSSSSLSSSRMALSRARHSSNTSTLAPVDNSSSNRWRNSSATSNLSTSTNNRRGYQGSFQLRSSAAAAAESPVVGLNRRASSASALDNDNNRSPGEHRIRVGSEDEQRGHAYSESQYSSSSSISDDDDEDDEDSTAAAILRDHLLPSLPYSSPTTTTRSPPGSTSGSHHRGTSRILHAARKLNTTHHHQQELYGNRESEETTTSSGSDPDEYDDGEGYPGANGRSLHRSHAAAAAAEDDEDIDEVTLGHYDAAALADEEAMLQYWHSQRNVSRAARAPSAHTYPLRNHPYHNRSSAGARAETSPLALTAADQRYARQAAQAIAAEQRNPQNSTSSQEMPSTTRRRLSMQKALWPFAWSSRSSRQRRDSI